MIVVDASAALDLLLQKPTAKALELRVFAVGEELHAPHLIDLEVVQALRRHVKAGQMSSERARQSLEAWVVFPVARHVHDLLLPRIWELRDSITAYDAAYVALAEALDATLLTTDARLARSHGHRAKIETIGLE
ncbi:type II toxin-antitoxin system VapC family toxin [Phenylobacterium sp.]|uniref:type II toxin-antitoxin system VapC family toxin n=1 Tax=Phenylobacterium sp. TaxID=1871053 RepID=UPI0025EBF668|nr:type II toxin-antitoxin system VapC family toxin [Phenylobacterium sp.]MBX3485691.1 type II toxin-antitoxin system VapC family toxin [Phenylobacterium sp.]MCW5759423.1 type II toxin-antitoxin system VapC family toxin [Phenylobacterium sp.]